MGGFWLANAVSGSVVTVSYYRLGESDPGATAGQAMAAAATDSGGAADLHQVGTAPVYSSDTGINGSTLSMEVNGGGYTNATPLVTLTDNWGLEAWVQAASPSATSCIAYNGNSANSGMGLYQVNDQFVGLIGGVAFVGGEPVVAGSWVHLALVLANGATSLYVNGAPVASGGAPRTPAGRFQLGIRADRAEAFKGRLDEVRVFTFAPDQFTVDDLLLTKVPPATQPPSIVSGPTATPSDTVMAGDALTLAVVGAGSPPLRFQWLKESVNLLGATNSTLAISKTTTNDAGNYSVRLSGLSGSVTSSVVVVKVLPAGSPGVTALAYYRLGEKDPGAVAGQPGTDPSLDSAGTNHLAVIGLPPVYSAGTGIKGSTLCLAVDGSGGYGLGAPLVTNNDNWGIEAWVATDSTTDNHCIAYNGNSGGSGMGIYQLGDRFAGLAGGVAVVGGAPAVPGAWTHLAIVVTAGATTFYVNGQATGTAGKPNLPKAEDTFSLGLKADAVETFQGRLDEVRVFSVLSGHFSAGDLLLSRVPPGALPPFVVSGPAASPGNTVLSGGSFTLSIQAGGTAPLQYQWRKGGVNIDGAAAGTVSFTNVTTAQSGAYEVVITNIYGSVTSLVASVTVLPPGSPTVAPVAYYRLGEKDTNALAGQAAGDMLVDSVGGFNLALTGLAPIYSADTVVAGSSLCLALDQGGYRYETPVITNADEWGIEAWVASGTTAENRCIAYNGNSSNSGMGLYQIGDHYQGLAGGVALIGSVPVTNGAWVHLAIVTSGGTTTLYANGVANGTAGRPNPPTSDQSAFSIGLKNAGAEMFLGRIDEVRLFNITLPGQFSTKDLLLTRVPPGGTVAPIQIRHEGGKIILTWSGNLQQADSLAGPWNAVGAATSPWTFTPAGSLKFYRAAMP